MPEIINVHSALPLNKQVEQYLRQLISQDEYRQGKMLPTELALSEELGVARNTIRAAMDKLVREGLIERKKGVGTQVKRGPIVTELTRWQTFALEMGDKLELKEKKVAWVHADPPVAAELGAQVNQRVCRLERLMCADGEPMVLLVDYFPPHLFIEENETFDGALYRVLRDKYGVRPVKSCEQISALSGGPIGLKLQLPREGAILCRRRRVLDSTGRLVQLQTLYYRGERFVCQIDLN